MPGTMESPSTAVDRTIAILEAVAARSSGMNNAEISRKLDIPKSSASYILRTLEKHGYLRREHETGKYRLGLKILNLARGALSGVDVREVARGHVAALEKGIPGQRYILGGENLTLKQILDKLAAITGLAAPKIRLPYVFALAAGAGDTLVSGRLLHREPRVTLDAVRMGRKKMWVSSEKAQRELGWNITAVDDALRRAAEWFQANGYVG